MKNDPIELQELQHRFQSHLLTPEADPLADMIVETPKVSRATRLHIYSNGYRERFVEAMDADYHQLHVLLGDEAFTHLIYAYLRDHPSQQPALRWFGAHLPAFLRQTQPYNQHPELAELAEFEWALCHAFDAADARTIELAQLTAIPADDFAGLTLDFHPSLQSLTLHCAAPQVWQALSEKPLITPPHFGWLQQAQAWLVWRQELRLMFRPATHDEIWALQAFCKGQTFGDVSEGLCRWHEENEVPQRAVTLLQQWFSDRLVVALSTTVQHQAQ